jgi:replicative DNA helicase
LADLRESGSIEADADSVFLLHLPEPGKIELAIAKNRDGGTGVIHLAFRPDLTRFTEASKIDEADVPRESRRPYAD